MKTIGVNVDAGPAQRRFLKAALGNDLSRPALMHVAVNGRRACATDGHRLHMTTLLEVQPSFSVGWHVPERPDVVYPEVDHLIEGLAVGPQLELLMQARVKLYQFCAMAEGANRHRWGRSGKFNYDYVGAVLEEDSDKIYVRWQTRDFSSPVEPLTLSPLAAGLKGLSVCFEPRYLLDILGKLPGDRLVLTFSQRRAGREHAPVHFSNCEGLESYAVLMPVRV